MASDTSDSGLNFTVEEAGVLCDAWAFMRAFEAKDIDWAEMALKSAHKFPDACRSVSMKLSDFMDFMKF